MVGTVSKLGTGFLLATVSGMSRKVFVHVKVLPVDQRSRMEGVKHGDEVQIDGIEEQGRGPRATSARLLIEAPAPQKNVRGRISELFESYGFITSEDARRIFFAPGLCASDTVFDDLYENDPVMFDDGESRGRPAAVNVRLVRDEAA